MRNLRNANLAWGLACVFTVRAWGAADATVVLRGGVPAPQGTVVSVDAAGVSMDLPGEQVQRVVLSWDKVASVQGVEGASDFVGVAEVAWRARSRLARGDAVGAEPLFETLFTKYEGQQGATAGVVASGLLRCRLSRQAQAAAVGAWLALVASGEQETVFDTPSLVADGIVVPAMMDAQTGLVPNLPPIWVASPAVDALATKPRTTPSSAPNAVAPRADVLSDLFRASAASTMGRTVTLPARSDDPGVALVWDVVAATAGNAQERAQARKNLNARLTGDTLPPQWEEAWCRVALGRSQSMDGDEEERLRGLVNLLHVPARLEPVSPYLAGVALVDAARVLERRGDVEGAGRVWRELAERFPGHPAQALRNVPDATLAPGAGGGK